jgi:hypothetical protein
MGTIDHQVVFRQIVELVRSGVGVVKSIRHSPDYGLQKFDISVDRGRLL